VNVQRAFSLAARSCFHKQEKTMKRLVLLALALLTTPVLAGDEPDVMGKSFVMPSGNIACTLVDVNLEGGSGPSQRLFCVRKQPKTIAVTLDEGGLESYPTDGDAQIDWSAPVLQYGGNWWINDFSCDSSSTGLLCSHSTYGAFELSRKGMKSIR
jgi:hypothetical protein